MNRLFISHKSALWVWRKVGPYASSLLAPTRVRSLTGGAPSQRKIEAFAREHPDLCLDEIDVMTLYADRRMTERTKGHVCDKPLPDRSFYRLEEDVYVASPELCLVQLASKLDVAQAVKLAMEMCGSYAVDVLDEEGFCKRAPLTNAQKIRAYVERYYRPGTRARSAEFAKWVADNAASPRESALYMLLCLPARFGGYGIAPPALNRRIELTLEEQLAVGRHHFDCDFYWQNRQVGLEYDSARHHTALEKQERDAVRRNMLQYKGINMITATRLQVNQEGQFDKLAHQVARAVGKKLPTPKREHVAARAVLRKTLFNWDVLSMSSEKNEP